MVGLAIGVFAGYTIRPTSSAAATNNANCKQPAKTPVGAKRFTPGPAKGGATPLPGATPVRPRPHLILGMITHPLRAVQADQRQVNAKNKKYMFYLIPGDVIRHTLPQYGFKPPVQVVSPPKPFPRYAGRPVRKAVVKYNGALYQVRVAQPGVQGPKGIWMIVTILPQKVRLGGIGQPAKVVAHEQHLADTNKKYAFYLNPSQVALKNAPQYGILAPVTLASRAAPVRSTTGRPTQHAIVKSGGVLYDVYVAQFGKRGPKGVWSIAFIDVHQP
jgi:hypothetical protein